MIGWRDQLPQRLSNPLQRVQSHVARRTGADDPIKDRRKRREAERQPQLEPGLPSEIVGLVARMAAVENAAALAQATADVAVTNAANAQSTANTAVSNAALAQATANVAVTNAATAQTAANNADAHAQNVFDVLDPRITALGG